MTAGSDAVTEIRLEDRRLDWFEQLQRVQDAVAAFLLAPAGWRRVQGGGTGRALGLVELAAVVALALVLVLELARTRRSGHDRAHGGRVAAATLLGGAVLLVEALAGWQDGGRLFRPILLSGLSGVGFGFAGPALEGRRRAVRRLRIDPAGIELRMSRIRRVRFAWSGLAAVEATASEVRFTTPQGRTRVVRLGRYRNGQEIADAIRSAAAERLIPKRAG